MSKSRQLKVRHVLKFVSHCTKYVVHRLWKFGKGRGMRTADQKWWHNTNVVILAMILNKDRWMIVKEVVHYTKYSICASYFNQSFREAKNLGALDSSSVNSWIETSVFNHCYETHKEGQASLKRKVAIDETWTWDFEPELKSQSAEWRYHSSSLFL